MWNILQRLFGRKSAPARQAAPNLKEHFERLDGEAHCVMGLVVAMGHQRTHYIVGMPHLLVAMVEVSQPVRDALREAGVDPFTVSHKAQERLGSLVSGNTWVPRLGPDLIRIVVEATTGRSGGVGPLALLRAILQIPELRQVAGEVAEELTVVPVECCEDRAEPDDAADGEDTTAFPWP